MAVLACPDREQLHAFRAGKLAEDASSQIAEHVDACDPCRSAIEALECSNDRFEAALRRSPPNDEFLNEPQCQQAIKAIQVFGVQPGLDSGLTGQVLRDYSILEKLGEGGMGAVY